MLKVIYLLFLCCLFVAGCKFNPNFQGRGTDFIQGYWEEADNKLSDSLIHYTRHAFRFACDSVYITMETQSRFNYYPDSCFNGGKWTEYAKGNYVVSNDTLYILATFTKSNFKQKLSDCYRIGQYLPVFIIKERSPEKIKLEGVTQHLPISLNLKEKITCIPKPL